MKSKSNVASCGHTVSTSHIFLATRSLSKNNQLSVRFGSYCPKCASETIAKDTVVEIDDIQPWVLTNTTEGAYNEQ
jgi:hypothetical protein